jgi:hypothetical protein
VSNDLAPSLPQCPETERAYVARILGWRDPQGPDSMDQVDASDFFSDDCRTIFTKLKQFKLQGRPVNDAVSLLDSLSASQKDDLGPFIADLVNPLYMTGDVDGYAKTIKEKSDVRRKLALSQNIVERLASANGNASEVLAEVSTLSEKLTSASSHRVVVTEDLKLPDMPESVLEGRIGEICKSRMGDFPLAYSWPALVTAAGVLMRPSNSTLRSNLYTALVGPPHSGKSQAIDRANRLMDLAPPLLAKVKPGSIEGFLKQEGGDKHGPVLLNPDELSHTLEKAQITNASFAYVLNTGFYEDELNLTVAHGAEVHFNRRLSVIGGIVDENFEESFGGATTGGLYDRFLFGQCPTGIDEYLFRPWEGTAAFDGQIDERHVNHDVWEARDEMVKREKLNPRLLEIALRVAAVCAAFDGRNELRACDLGPAWELARYQARVRLLLKPNAGKNFEAQVAAKILNYLNRYAPDGGWLVLRKVLHATNANNYGPSVVNRALDAMAFSGSIERSEQPAPKGQKRRLVRIVVEASQPAATPAPDKSVPAPKSESAKSVEIDDDDIPF